MKRAFTLIELIFSIVIIAIVFTVVPKLIFSTNKTMELSIKEDGLFSAIALMGEIVRLPWDENTSVSGGKILDTDTSSCNDYRIGGFKGSRNCIGPVLAATPKGGFGSSGSYGDIDDFDAYAAATGGGRGVYNITAAVDYVDKDFNLTAGTSDVKRVEVKVRSTGKTELSSGFFYYSANLGHIQINKRAW